MKIKILVPVYNDWQSLSQLMYEINNSIITPDFQISIIIVNDASNHDRKDENKNLKNINSIKILNMKKNQGHARCIATGLKYIYEKEDFDYIIPMDGDGEDRPAEIEEFLKQINNSNNKAIVGERIKRSENLLFKICYQIHKLITLTFTGKSIKFGNFTCLPKSIVEKMVNEKATWNSFSGSLKKIENDIISVPSVRGIRYFGPSKMNFLNLVKHSLSIIAVFKASVIIRSIAFYAIYLILISNNLSVITCIPLALIVIFGILIVKISGRENIDEFNSCLNNIDSVDTIK